MELDGRILVIRADAGAHIGSGHLMRCLALAQAWQDRGGQAVFVTACDSADLRRRLGQEGFPLIHIAFPHPDPADWQVTSGVLQEHPGAWVVLDGYHFDPVYQRRIRQAGHPLLMIDDTAHLEHYYADIVLNQNLQAHELNYPCEPDTQLLLGTKHVLLRREFLKWRGWKREITQVARKVLVTMGGSDPGNVTLKVLGALDAVDVEGLEVIAVVGASNPHFESLQAAAHSSRHSVRLVSDPVNMTELMAWADLAISAAGSTCWELAFMGLPSCVMAVADNQALIAQALQRQGAVISLGCRPELSRLGIAQSIKAALADRTKRSELSTIGCKLVDGAGPFRILEKLSESLRERVDVQ